VSQASDSEVLQGINQLLLEALQHLDRTPNAPDDAALPTTLERERAFLSTIEQLVQRRTRNTALRNRVEAAVVIEYLVDALVALQGANAATPGVLGRKLESLASAIVTPTRDFPDDWGERLARSYISVLVEFKKKAAPIKNKDSREGRETHGLEDLKVAARRLAHDAVRELLLVWCPELKFDGVARANRVLREQKAYGDAVIKNIQIIEFILNQEWILNTKGAVLLVLRSSGAPESLISAVTVQMEKWIMEHLPLQSDTWTAWGI